MKKKDKKVLEEIQVRANAIYGDKLWVKRQKADAILEVIDKALTEKSDMFSEDDLKKLQSIKESHILDGEEDVIDDAVLKKMDKYIGDEVTKAIKEGTLSHPKEDAYYKKINKLIKKQNGTSNKGSKN